MKRIFLSLLALAVMLSAVGCAAKDNMVSLAFPAYEDGKTEFNSQIYETPSFLLSLSLPDGWSTRLPEAGNRLPDPFFTPVEICRGEEAVGSVGFGAYEEYEGSDLPEGDYYKVVYSAIRMGSLSRWEDYAPVKTTETGETALATVYCLDPQETEQHPGAMAEVPVVQTPGILSYDKELHVYIGIRFAENSVTQEELQAIAQSVSIRPAK